jgi:hypothetical protein
MLIAFEFKGVFSLGKINYRIIFSVLFIIVPTMYFGCTSKPTEMGLAIIMGSTISAFINIDKFSSFKGAGFEAQLRDLKETIREANIKVEELKQILEHIVLHNMFMITNIGLFNGGGSTEDKDKIRDSCKMLIEKYSIDNSDINRIFDEYERYQKENRI